MIPGSVSKLSESSLPFAATIRPKTDLVLVNGAGTINNIIPPLNGSNAVMLILVPLSAGLILGVGTGIGSILVGITCAQNRPVFLVYSKLAGKWLINSGV